MLRVSAHSKALRTSRSSCLGRPARPRLETQSVVIGTATGGALSAARSWRSIGRPASTVDETRDGRSSESHCLAIHSLTNRSTRRLACLMAFDGTLVID